MELFACISSIGIISCSFEELLALVNGLYEKAKEVKVVSKEKDDKE